MYKIMEENTGMWILSNINMDNKYLIVKQLAGIYLNEWKDRIRMLNKEFEETWTINHYYERKYNEKELELINSGNPNELSVQTVFLSLDELKYPYPEFENYWGMHVGYRVFPIERPPVMSRMYKDVSLNHNMWNFKTHKWIGLILDKY